MSRIRPLRLLVACFLVTVAMGDYDCLCTTDDVTNLYQYPDVTSQIDTVLYKYDCRPVYRVDGIDPDFGAVGNNHKLNYLFLTTNTRVQLCQGSIPGINQVSFLTTTTDTTHPSLRPTTKTTAKTTHKPTTATTTTTTPQATTTSTPPKMTFTTLSTKTTTQKPTTTPVLTTTSLPIKLNTTPIKSTSATTGTVPLTTEPTTTYSTTSIMYVCPMSVVQQSHPGNVFRRGTICYEYVQRRDTWYTARDDCNKKGGHLVSIKDQATQDYIYNLVHSVHDFSTLWMGLHDELNEETWKWNANGSAATYTNWMESRYVDEYHDQEDCGLFVYHRHGQWDNIVCDGQMHPWICQYDVVRQVATG